MTTATLLEALRQDLRIGIRALCKTPAFSLAVILTIALGIGANTAMFSVIRAVLQKPLAYHEPDRVVMVADGSTPIRFEEIAATSRSYTQLGAFANGFEDMALSGIGEPEVLKAARVSANFLDILEVNPLRGRSFFAQEDKPDAAPVALISTALWQRRFSGDPSIVGRTITLASVPYTVVGVLPPGFQFPLAGADVWVTKPEEWSVIAPKNRALSPTLSIFGRLKPGVNLQQATAELAVLDGQYATAHPDMLDSKPDSPDVVRPVQEELVSDVRSKLWMLFGAVGFVMLIVCANIGGLLLARASSRTREFAVRAAIGAGRGRIVGQLLTESMLLAVLGGVLGVAVAALVVPAIRSITFVDLPRSGEVRLDVVVLAFGALLALLTGVVFGLAPSLAASRPDLAVVLRGSGEGSIAAASGHITRWNSRSFLVVGQIALSIILLIGATLLIESLAHLYRVDLGFRSANLLTVNVSLSPTRYDTDQRRATFYDQLVQRIESLPGVRNAAVTLTVPMGGFFGTTVQVTGRPPVPLNQRPIAIIQDVSPSYFQTMGIAMKRGRSFTSHDSASGTPAVIVNETLVHLFWPQYPAGPDPIGQHILTGTDPRPVEIVGIAANIRANGRDQGPRAETYFPSAQRPPQAATLVVRTNGDPLSFANSVRSQVLAIDPNQPVSEISTMDNVIEESEGQLRLMMRLLGTFAGAATLLAVIGLYGVISYSVLQRTKEIGIRRALGAPANRIVGLVAMQVIGLALAGVVLGVAGAFALTRLIGDLLFQVSPTDPVTFFGIAVLFVLVALAASWIPARRAAAVDPMAALRIG
jgi:putative ABC transport system permease protein